MTIYKTIDLTEDLEDVDSADIDATPHSQAVAVLNALIDSVVPR